MSTKHPSDRGASENGAGDRVTFGDAPTIGAGETADKQKRLLFYQKPEALNRERHGDLCLKNDAHYGFARNANAVPLNAVEFAIAVKHYPIVFTAETHAVPVAILGLRQGQNLFVDGQGAWVKSQYVPAYVRRYPFLLVAAPDNGGKLALCVDTASDLLEQDGARRLFEAGEPSDLAKRVLEICSGYMTQQELTRQFAAAILEQELLGERTIEVARKNGGKLTLKGFRTIDEKKFNALPDEIFLAWRKRGWLAPIYAHLMSLGNWPALVARAEQS